MHCTYPNCYQKANLHLSWIEDRHCAKEQHLCEPHAKAVLTSEPWPVVKFSLPRQARADARQFDFLLIVISEIHDQQVVYLQEVGGSYRIPLLIGIFEAMSLQRILKREVYPRPLTHDVIASAIRLLDGEVCDVTVN